MYYTASVGDSRAVCGSLSGPSPTKLPITPAVIPPCLGSMREMKEEREVHVDL